MLEKTFKILTVIAIVVMFCIINTSKVFSNKVTSANGNGHSIMTGFIGNDEFHTEDALLQYLIDNFGYTGNNLGQAMRCDTNIIIEGERRRQHILCVYSKNRLK